MSAFTGKMKAYSIDFREKIVKAYEQGDTSVRKVADRFGVAKSFVQKIISMKKSQGHIAPGQQGGAMKGQLDGYEAQLAAMVEKYPDATLLEYCRHLQHINYAASADGKIGFYPGQNESTSRIYRDAPIRSPKISGTKL